MNTEMHVAAEKGDVDLMEKLQKEGFDVNQKDQNGSTPMHLAARYGHVACLDVLFKFGGDINAKDNDGDTPMHKAATSSGPEPAVLCLFGIGAKDDVKNSVGFTPLDVTKKLSYTEVNANRKKVLLLWHPNGMTPELKAKQNGI